MNYNQEMGSPTEDPDAQKSMKAKKKYRQRDELLDIAPGYKPDRKCAGVYISQKRGDENII